VAPRRMRYETCVCFTNVHRTSPNTLIWRAMNNAALPTSYRRYLADTDAIRISELEKKSLDALPLDPLLSSGGAGQVGQPLSRAHWSTSTCPAAVARSTVRASHGHSCSRSHFSASRYPPWAALAHDHVFHG